MPKKQTDSLSEIQSKLNALMVKKSSEKTTIYDKDISELKSKLDYINYGIRKQKC